jgi:sugar/nucleoside kinase (ribokinase family)
MKYDIITFGSATRDIFLRTKQFLIGDFKIDHFKKEICLPYGLKIDIQNIHFHSGGGGTNTAATFVAQGLKTAYCGVIGRDLEGKFVHNELLEKGIDTRFLLKTNKKPTNVSIIFSTPQERTILVYKGASQFLEKKMIPWSQVKNTGWFYLAALSGKSAQRFKDLIGFAKKNEIKVMANPGNSQLNLSSKDLYTFLKKIDILLLNREEGRMLVGNPLLHGEKLVRQIKKIFPGILILTNGEHKIFVDNGKFLFTAIPLKTKVLDKTGAGDSFGAGFLSGYIKNQGDIIKAVQLAVANSASCIKKWGAKEGILEKNQKFKRVKVFKSARS